MGVDPRWKDPRDDAIAVGSNGKRPVGRRLWHQPRAMAKPRLMVGSAQIPQRCEGGVGRDPGALVTVEGGDERAPGGGPGFRRCRGECRPSMEWAGGIAPGLGQRGREWIPGCHAGIQQRC